MTINRKESINAVLRNLDKEEYRSSWESGAVKVMKDTLENMSSADRPQGERTYLTDIVDFGRCNNCKALWNKSLIDNIYFKYCPRCGARMFAKDINVPNKKGADDERP